MKHIYRIDGRHYAADSELLALRQAFPDGKLPIIACRYLLSSMDAEAIAERLNEGETLGDILPGYPATTKGLPCSSLAAG